MHPPFRMNYAGGEARPRQRAYSIGIRLREAADVPAVVRVEPPGELARYEDAMARAGGNVITSM
jgi:hypothetical protein